MAYPDNTNTNRGTRRATSINRDGEGWGFVPILLAVLALFAVGYMMFGQNHTNTANTNTGMSRTSEAPARAPGTTTPTPGTPSPTR